MCDFNADCKVEGCGRESVDSSGYCKKHKPSAPTADVEPDLDYMANVLWSWHEQGRLNRHDIKTALAQARAPLVEALEKIEHHAFNTDQLVIANVARAALTGTGESIK